MTQSTLHPFPPHSTYSPPLSSHHSNYLTSFNSTSSPFSLSVGRLILSELFHLITLLLNQIYIWISPLGDINLFSFSSDNDASSYVNNSWFTSHESFTLLTFRAEPFPITFPLNSFATPFMYILNGYGDITHNWFRPPCTLKSSHSGFPNPILYYSTCTRRTFNCFY